MTRYFTTRCGRCKAGHVKVKSITYTSVTDPVKGETFHTRRVVTECNNCGVMHASVTEISKEALEEAIKKGGAL